MNPNELLSAIVAINDTYKVLYSEGLLGVNGYNVQVTPSAFAKVAIGKSISAGWNGDKLEITARLGNVDVITLITIAE